MKKLLSLSLAAVMLLALLAGCTTPKNDPGATGTTPPPTQTGGTETPVVPEGPVKPTEPTGRLVVGGNALNADFFAGWSNLVSNSNAKDLMAGGSTVAYTEDDKFIVNPTVVKNFEETLNDDGSKTYTIELNQGMVWNDGTPITAKDYVFSLLFDLSPQLLELECDRATGMTVYTGATAYNDGETDVLAGMRLLGDYQFSVTVDAETDGEANFPFWFEITYANIAPLPAHVLAPGCGVEDTGDGVRITGDFTVDLLKSTLDNGETGFRYTPTVTCGPYNFVSYDAAAAQVVLEANPLFAGDENGVKPLIKTLVIKLVEDATAIDELASGAIDLYCQVSGATKINAGLDLHDEGKVEFSTYARNGYGRIVFKCDYGPTQFAEVRRAIAWCMDREEFVRQYTGGYGVIVHSRVGSAQWTYLEARDELDSKFTNYTLNVEKAVEELVNGGWIYDANGGDYVSGIRHKKLDDGTYMPLIIDWFSPDSNLVGEMLGGFLIENAESIGFKINQTWGTTAEFSNALYGSGDKKYNMINGGAGFAVMDSPWYYYDPAMPVQYNTNVIDDEILKSTTAAMRVTESGDNAAYLEKWKAFVLRYNELMPDVPLYSDEYHDFYHAKLQDYNPSALWSWQYAIINAWVSE